MRIFLSAPFRENKELSILRMAHIKKKLTKEFPDFEFFVPHGNLDADQGEQTDESMAMIECLCEIANSDAVWVCGPHSDSPGVTAEIAFCNAVGKPVEFKCLLWNGLYSGFQFYSVDKLKWELGLLDD